MDHRSGARRVDGVAANRAVRGGAARKDQAQIARTAGVAGRAVDGGGQHLELVGADQTQPAFTEFDGDIGLTLREIGYRSQTVIDRIQCWQCAALALSDSPVRSQKLGVEVPLQLGDRGVAGGTCGSHVNDGLNLVADLVDLGDQPHVVAQDAVGRDGPVRQDQFMEIGRGQDVDTVGRTDMDHAVVARGAQADRSQQHQTAAVIRGGLAGCTRVVTALQVDLLASGQVGADDQLPIGTDADLRIHIVRSQLTAGIFSLSGDDIHPAAGHKQAVHAHIVDAVEINEPIDIGPAGAQSAAAAVLGVVPGSFGDDFRGAVNQQAGAADIGTTAYPDFTAGVEVTRCVDRRASLISGGAADEGAAGSLDQEVRCSAAPGDRLGHQLAIADGLAESATGGEGAHQFGAALGLYRDRAASAVGAQAGPGDTAGRVDQDRQTVVGPLAQAGHQGVDLRCAQTRIFSGQAGPDLGLHSRIVQHVQAVPVVVAARSATGQSHIAAGQQARFQPYLLGGLNVDAGAAIAVGVQGEGGPAATVAAAGEHQTEHIDILLAAYGHAATGLGGDQLGNGVHVHAGAAAVGSGAAYRLAGRAVTAEHADGLGSLEFGLHVDPFVGLEGQGGTGAAGLHHAAHDEVLSGSDLQVLVRPQADDVAVDQEPVAAGVAGDVGQLRSIEPAEIAGLVVDAVLRLIARCAGVGAVVGHIVSLVARLYAEVATEGDQASDQHFLV